jgi:hypothetical protein
MSRLDHEDRDDAVDALLSRSAPAPDTMWVAELEHRLLPGLSSRRPWYRTPRLRLGAAVAVGLTLFLLLLTLTGEGPLSDGSSSVRAREDCKEVLTPRAERVPTLVAPPDGQPHLVYRRQQVARFERRCR